MADFPTETNYLSHLASYSRSLPDSFNPLIQRGITNKIFLKIVAKKILALNEGQVATNKLVKVIAIARDRMKNYIDCDGSLNESASVDINSDGRIIMRTISARELKRQLNSYIKLYAPQLEAYDAAEAQRIRAQYEASKQKRY